MRARQTAGALDGDDVFDLAQAEAETLRLPHERHQFERVATVDAVARRGAPSRGQDACRLVQAQGLPTRTALLHYLTDQETVLVHHTHGKPCPQGQGQEGGAGRAYRDAEPPGRIIVRGPSVHADRPDADPRAVPPRRLGLRTAGVCSPTRTVTASDRHGRDHTRRLADVARAIGKLLARTLVLDGAVAMYDDQLRSRFDWLRESDRDAVATPPLYMAFDLLYRNGRDLTERPLRDRRARLEVVRVGVRRATAGAGWPGSVEAGGRARLRELRREGRGQHVRRRADTGVAEGQDARLDPRRGPRWQRQIAAPPAG